MIRTATIRHLTIDSGHAVTSSRGDVADDVVAMLAPVIRAAHPLPPGAAAVTELSTEELTARLRFIATVKADGNALAGHKGDSWAKEAEIEWQAAEAIEAAARSLRLVEAERDELRKQLERAQRDGIKRKRQELDPDPWLHGHHEGWVAGIEFALSKMEMQDAIRSRTQETSNANEG